MGRTPQPDPQPLHLSTNDLGFASFLVCRGHSLSRLDGPPHAVSFVFTDVDPVEFNRYAGGFVVPAVLFATTQRRLYTLIRRRQAESTKLAREVAALSVVPQPKPAETLEPA